MKREEIVNNIGYQLTRAALEYVEKHEFADEMDCFEAGAEWMQETMIDKAENWLKENFFNSHAIDCYGCFLEETEVTSSFDTVEEMMESFHKTMEE